MFQIEVTEVLTISGRGQIITGKATDVSYKGWLCCDGKMYEVIGYEMFNCDKNKCTLLLDTFDLTQDMVGKIFTEADELYDCRK